MLGRTWLSPPTAKQFREKQTADVHYPAPIRKRKQSRIHTDCRCPFLRLLDRRRPEAGGRQTADGRGGSASPPGDQEADKLAGSPPRSSSFLRSRLHPLPRAADEGGGREAADASDDDAG